jgi:alcohol dehydrogenase
MKAVVYHGPKRMQIDEVEDPRILDPRDVIVRVTSTAICGSDLHIYNGFFPQLSNFVMGHEFMGVIEEVGSGVRKWKAGDRVVVPFPVACGECFFCTHDSPVNCEHSNPEKDGPDGGLLDGKGGGCSAIRSSTAAMTAAKRSTCACPSPTTGRGMCPRT